MKRFAVIMFVAFCAEGAAGQEACRGLIQPDCLARVGAGTLKAGPDCEAQFARYRDCLTALIQSNGDAAIGEASASRCSPDQARELWEIAAEDNDCLSYQTFIEVCPEAARTAFAETRLQRLGCGGRISGAEPKPDATDSGAAQLAPAVKPQRGGYYAAQRELMRLELYDGVVDGEWGPSSQQAMTDFKRQAGIEPVDGAWTQAAMAALKEARTPAPKATLPLTLQAPQPLSGLMDKTYSAWFVINYEDGRTSDPISRHLYVSADGEVRSLVRTPNNRTCEHTGTSEYSRPLNGVRNYQFSCVYDSGSVFETSGEFRAKFQGAVLEIENSSRTVQVRGGKYESKSYFNYAIRMVSGGCQFLYFKSRHDDQPESFSTPVSCQVSQGRVTPDQ